MAGFYGKLPTKGDFLTRRVPRDFVDVWDEWLQAGMNDSRQSLGEEWLQIYLTSPLWRFVVPPGVLGSSGWAGVVMPSMDKVGRYFPMTVATELAPPFSQLLVVTTCSAWFESVENTLLDALEDESLDLDVFDDNIAELNIDQSTVGVEQLMEKALSSAADIDQGVRSPLSAELNVAQTFLSMTSSVVQEALAPCSIWWGHGSERIPPSLAYCRGLPGTGKFSAMLDGHWSSHGWNDVMMPSADVLTLSPDLAAS